MEGLGQANGAGRWKDGGGGDERGEMVEGLGVRLYADKTLVVSLL